jgi:hypothetical protein
MRLVAALLAAFLVSSCAGGFGRPGARGASAAAGGSAPAAAAPCTSADGATASGGMSCRAGTYYRCSNGAWQETALSCSR